MSKSTATLLAVVFLAACGSSPDVLDWDELPAAAKGEGDRDLGECQDDPNWSFYPRAISLSQSYLRAAAPRQVGVGEALTPQYPARKLGEWVLGDTIPCRVVDGLLTPLLEASTCFQVLDFVRYESGNQWLRVWVKPQPDLPPIAGWIWGGTIYEPTVTGDLTPRPLGEWTHPKCAAQKNDLFDPKAISLTYVPVYSDHGGYSLRTGKEEHGEERGVLQPGTCVQVLNEVDAKFVEKPRWYLVRYRQGQAYPAGWVRGGDQLWNQTIGGAR